MQGIFNWIRLSVAVKVLVYLTSFGAWADLNAEKDYEDHPERYESYEDRPDILKLPAKAQSLDKNWQDMKAAHFAFVAELFAIYPPDTHFYFLARDSEYLYDVASLVTEGTADAAQVHLLNVSRGNMRHDKMYSYLVENGLSEDDLRVGKNTLFVDTGFAGTISRVVSQNYSADSRKNLKTHLIVSSNPEHPSSRAFLMHLNPTVVERRPSEMHSTIVTYEHMARYTDRSSEYAKVNGKFQPVSLKKGAVDGTVSKDKSIQYMMDLKSEWEKPATKKQFQNDLRDVRRIKDLFAEGTESSRETLKAELAKRKTEDGVRFEAFVRDVYEAKINTGHNYKFDLTALGLTSNSANSFNAFTKSNKNDLIKKFPEWATILEDPVTTIPKLFKDQDWQMIGNLIDADVDAEVNALLAKELYDAPSNGIKKQLQFSMIEKGNTETLETIVVRFIETPHRELA